MPDISPNVSEPLAARSETDLQPVHQADAPVVIDRRPQVVHVDDMKIDGTPQVVAGRVRASDDVSNQAVEQGYQPDIQPKAAAPAITLVSGVADTALAGTGVVAGLGGVVTDDTAGQMKQLIAEGKTDEAIEIANDSLAKKEAFERLTAPLSIKTELAVQDAKGELPDLAVVEGSPSSVEGQAAAVEESLKTQAERSGFGSDGPTTQNDAEIVAPQATTDPTVGGSPTGPVETPIQNPAGS